MICLIALSLQGTIAKPDFRQWGLQTVDGIRKEFLLPDGGLYGEEIKVDGRPTSVAFTWSVGVLLEALDAAAAADPRYRRPMEDFISATRVYWNTTGPVPGYDVLPAPKPVDRYYDDNEWMVLGLAEAARVAGSKRYLDFAIETFRYVMSGEDAKLGGGIYWHETDKRSKNTCSNAPAAAGAIAIYEETKDAAYLQAAERLYAWTKEHLRDPLDGLYWDNESLDGKVQKWKFSYNTGLMLRTAAELYHITGRQEYAQDAKEMQSASLQHWTDAQGSFTDDVKFMQLLVGNWILAFRLVPDIQNPWSVIELGLTRLHDVSRDALGHYGNKCNDVPNGKPYSPYKLIDQAAAARMYLDAAAG